MLLETIVILITYLTISEAQNEAKIVTINQGPVRGYKALNSEVFEFFGIRYAAAPTGSDKFKPPLPPPTWTDTFDAVEHDIACPQQLVFAESLQVQEDCLIANVFTPSTSTTNLPVLIYIHGGGFIFGDGNSWSPRPLVESQKIVAVTINYRLGAHGFLCLGTEDVPGNAGLRDILAALRWVKENIASFGGNPDDVTVAGYSAGAAAAGLLSLSNATEGLLHKLILDSGTHVAGFIVQIDPIENAQVHAKSLGFDNTGNLNALEEFYKTLSYELLVSDSDDTPNLLSFTPCIEKDIGQEIIIDDTPTNIIKSSRYRKFSGLYGFGNMEGIFRIDNFDDWAPEMNEKFSEFLAQDFVFENDDQKEELAQTVKEFYFGDKTVGLKTLFNYIDYYTDVHFAYDILRSVKLQSEAGNEQTFLYEYTFYNIYNPVPGVPDVLTNFPGATHCSQTGAVLEGFRVTDQDQYSEAYKQMRIKMREIWVNFVTTGTPVPEGSSLPSWPPANATRSPYMILGDTIELGGSLNEQRTQFWDSIYDKYDFRHPMPPTFVESETESNTAHLFSGNLVRNLLFACISYFILT